MHDDTPIENLLRRRQVMPEPVGGDVCGDPELLAAYAEGALTAAERNRVEAHLAACGACQEAVVRLVRMAPQESAAARQPQPEAARQPASGWLRWRWAVTAMASIALVGSFVYYEYERIAGTRPYEIPVVKEGPPPAAAQPAPSEARPEPAPPVPAPSAQARAEAPQKRQVLPPSIVAGGAAGSKLGKVQESEAKLDTFADAQSKKSEPAAEVPERRPRQVFQAQNQAPGGSTMQQAAPAPPMAPPKAEAPRVAADEVAATGRVAEAGPRRQDAAKGKEETEASKDRARDVPSARLAAAAPAMRREATADDKRFGLTAAGRMMYAEEDRANEWRPLNVPTNAMVIDFAAIGTHLWVLLPNGRVGHSTDSGKTWGPPVDTGASDAVRIIFRDAKNGEIRTTSGKRLTTADGGETWKP